MKYEAKNKPIGRAWIFIPLSVLQSAVDEFHCLNSKFLSFSANRGPIMHLKRKNILLNAQNGL